MRKYVVVTAALLLVPAPLGAVPAGQVTEISPLVLVQDSKSDSKDKAKKKKKDSTSSSAPKGGSPGSSTKDSY